MPVMKVWNATTSQWEDVGAGGLTNPMTTAGDIIYGGASGAPTRLAKGTDGQVLTLASGLPAWGDASGGSLLVAEATVSGSAVTSVTFSGLDGNADGGYVLEATHYNPTASTDTLSLYINSDNTNANYTWQKLAANNTTIAVSRLNTSIFAATAPSTASMHIADISRSSSDSKTFALVRGVNSVDTLNTVLYGLKHNVAVTNITALAIVSNTANSIGIGSTFRLYRKK